MLGAIVVSIVLDGEGAGAEVTTLTCDAFAGTDVTNYDAVAFGCPAMGAEVLEETTFEPMFTEAEGLLSGKKVAIFGSYGWGDGQWMRDWEERMKAAGATLVGGEGLILNETPDSDGLEACAALGKELAAL